MAFDVLWADGERTTHRSYAERRAVLEGLDLDHGGVVAVNRFDGTDADALLRACQDHGVEGVVLKRLASPYRAGQRSGDWRKLKCQAWRDHMERRRPR